MTRVSSLEAQYINNGNIYDNILTEIWESIKSDNGYIQEYKLNGYIDYYMVFFKNQIIERNEDYNKITSDIKTEVWRRYEHYRIGQCSICGEIKAGNEGWGRTDFSWKHKICKKCNGEYVECFCCGAKKVRKYYPFVEEEDRYSDVCIKCVNIIKKEYKNNNLTTLEIEDLSVKYKEDKIKAENEAKEILKTKSKAEYEKYMLNTKVIKSEKAGVCKCCNKFKTGHEKWGRLDWGFLSGICLDCRAKMRVKCDCCGNTKLIKYYNFDYDKKEFKTICKSCEEKATKKQPQKENKEKPVKEKKIKTINKKITYRDIVYTARQCCNMLNIDTHTFKKYIDLKYVKSTTPTKYVKFYHIKEEDLVKFMEKHTDKWDSRDLDTDIFDKCKPKWFIDKMKKDKENHRGYTKRERCWTDKEEAYVIEARQNKIKFKDIGAKLNRSEGSVKHKYRSLIAGIKSKKTKIAS